MHCQQFAEELENYAKEVEEFSTFGDVQELDKYLKKAQALNAKLDVAGGKVHVIVESSPIV